MTQLTIRERWAIATLILSAVGAPPLAAAGERAVFRSELPDGGTIYSDAPVEGAARSARVLVEPHAPDTAQARAAQRELEGIRQRLQQDTQARSLRLEQFDRSVTLAAQELASAQSAQVDGQAIGEGDRQGRRISPAYWERQERLAEAVARTRMRLDALSARSAALR